jgi:hypothetical protein
VTLLIGTHTILQISFQWGGALAGVNLIFYTRRLSGTGSSTHVFLGLGKIILLVLPNSRDNKQM